MGVLYEIIIFENLRFHASTRLKRCAFGDHYHRMRVEKKQIRFKLATYFLSRAWSLNSSTTFLNKVTVNKPCSLSSKTKLRERTKEIITEQVNLDTEKYGPIKRRMLGYRVFSLTWSASMHIGTKGGVCIRKELNSHRICLEHQHGRRFIVLGHLTFS